PQATTQGIIAGLEWALNKSARVINMSFAGPYDPMLALAMKRASEKGAVLIAAVGNAGPKSPPLYPAADPRVIGVTAVDENDQLAPLAELDNRVTDMKIAAPAAAPTPAPLQAAAPRAAAPAPAAAATTKATLPRPGIYVPKQ